MNDSVGTGLIVMPDSQVMAGFAGQLTEQGQPAPGLADVIRGLLAMGRKQWTWSSIPASETQGLNGAARMMRIRRGPSDDLASMLDEVFEVKHVLIHPASRTSTEGEVESWARILFIGQDDHVWSTASETMLGQLDEIIQAGYPPPWNPPLRLRVSRKTTTPPRSILVLEIVTDATALPRNAAKERKADK